MDLWMIAFGFFALLTSASPDPKNVMVTASGANFDFRRTLHRMFGVALEPPSGNLNHLANCRRGLSASPGQSAIGEVMDAYRHWRRTPAFHATLGLDLRYRHGFTPHRVLGPGICLEPYWLGRDRNAMKIKG